MLVEYGLDKDNYAIFIARAEPENSVLEMVATFSVKPRSSKLVVLGKFEPETNPYHKAVIEAASDEVVFPGVIYDADKLAVLRFYARFWALGWCDMRG